MLKLPVACGLVVSVYVPHVKTGVMQRSHPRSLGQASKGTVSAQLQTSKKDWSSSSLMIMTASKADAHRIGFKVPMVNWAHTQSQGRGETRSKDTLKFVNSVTPAYAVDAHTPDRPGF